MKCRPGSLPMEGFVASCTDRLADRLKSHVVIALKNDGAEPIHDLRVAGRRLRNALRLFRNFYSKRTRKETRGELKEFMKIAGKVRDRDIAVQIVFSLENIGAVDLLADIRVERVELKKELDRLLRKERKTCRCLCLSPRDPSTSAKISTRLDLAATAQDNAHKVLPLLVAAVLEGAKEPLARPILELLHELRISLKRLRDTLEMFSACYDHHLDRFIKMLGGLLHTLGELNDIATTRKILSERQPLSQSRRLSLILEDQITNRIPEFVRLSRKTIGDEQVAQHWLEYLAARP
jgi:CHAD domain-containing protein